MVVMNEKKTPMLPKLVHLLEALGSNIKMARLRRKMGTAMMAERAGISRTTLQKIERGDAGVGIGLYLQVLVTLGLEEDLRKVAADDLLGRKLQDSHLLMKKRAPKQS